MKLSDSKCKEKTVPQLKGMCTRLGLPKPIGKRENSEKALIDSCCVPDVLALGDVSEKGKITRVSGDSGMMRYETKDKNGNNIKHYAKCKSGLWGETKENNRIFGNFVGYKCKVIICEGEKCDRAIPKDAVTIKKMVKGYSFDLIKLSPLNINRNIFDSL